MCLNNLKIKNKSNQFNFWISIHFKDLVPLINTARIPIHKD